MPGLEFIYNETLVNVSSPIKVKNLFSPRLKLTIENVVTVGRIANLTI